MREIHKMHQSKEELTPIIFIDFQYVKYHKIVTNTPKTHSKIPKILQEKQGTQGSSDSKTVGVHSKEIKRNEKKTQAQGHRPKPVPQVDPDHS